ncbi:MAG: uroporphyrinogen III synthase [Methylobacter sp.]|nr:MAG: uroporphyrinogen III synthase [Methylobacter sp.]PPD23249.1 MAG: uroporphyrinogen III synthase [Methylobacter sp.]PPD37064.1 MAG: uroporphyrinogen III synthase [Methylomonas sp.]
MLNGMHVLVTRPAHQAKPLAALIAESGGVPVCLPALAVTGPDEPNLIKPVLADLKPYNWLVFISVNAVDFALKANDGKIDQFREKRLLAIGKATAKRLQAWGLTAELAPEGSDSEALLASPTLQAIAGQRVLIVRGQGGRETLAEGLRAQKAQVDYLEVYKRVKPDVDTGPVLQLMEQSRLHAITVTSGEALQNLREMLSPKLPKLLTIPLIVISGRLKQLAAEMGFKQIVVADSPADAAILKSVITVNNGEECGRIE